MFRTSRLKELAVKTPASRDRCVDFLRAFSITVVVLGHWISALIIRNDGGVDFRNVVGGVSPGMWAATWVLQVMPIFFFIGGFSNFVTFDSFKRKGKPVSAFLRTRAVRLLRPTSVFLVVWSVLFIVVYVFFREKAWLVKSTLVLLGPLWFLAVYIVVVLFAPIMWELHRRYHFLIPVILAVLTVIVDILRFGMQIPVVKWVNVAFVWLFVHQLGFFYADGSLLRVRKWVHVVMAVGGLAVLIVLTNIGVYPKSMMGTWFEKVSNMNPPTICIVVLTCWLIGAAMLLRNRVNRWLSRLRPWMTVIAANTVIMTFYLWHLTAFAIAYLLLYPIGLAREIDNKLFWLLQRPVWIIVPGIILAGLVAIFGRFERPVRQKQTGT